MIAVSLYSSLTDTSGRVVEAPDALDFLTSQHRMFPSGTIANVIEQVVAKAAGNPLPGYEDWQRVTKGSLPLYRFSTVSNRAAGSDPGMMTALVVEIDAGSGAPADAVDRLLAASAGYRAILMTSTGHSDQYPAVRMVLPLSPAIPATMYEALVQWMQIRVTGASGGRSWLSTQEMNATRAWFAPAGYPEVTGNMPPSDCDPNGVTLDWRTLGLTPPADRTQSISAPERVATSDLAVTEQKCAFARAIRDDAEMPYQWWTAALMLWRSSYLNTPEGDVSGMDLVALRESGRLPARYLGSRTLAQKVDSFTGEAPRQSTIAEHFPGCATCPLALTCRSPIQHGEANRDDLGDVQRLVARWKRALDAAIHRGDTSGQAAIEENLREAQERETRIRSRIQAAAAAAVPRGVVTLDKGNDTELARLWLQRNPSATCTADMTAVMVPQGEGSGLWRVIELPSLALHFQGWQGDGIHVVRGAVDPVTGLPKLIPVAVDVEKSRRAASSVLASVVAAESDSRGVLARELPDHLLPAAQGGIPYRSGLVGYDGTLMQIRLDDRITTGDLLPGDYNPTAHAPRFMRFLADMFDTCTPEHAAAYISVIQEFAGACLAGQGTRCGKMILLTGDGANGKSTLMSCIRRLFRPDRVGSVQPATVGEERQRTSLFGKHINIVDDMSCKYLGDTGLLKTMITGDARVNGRRLNHETFDFTPRTGWIAGINTLPTVTDASDGFWRRVLVIPCATSFLGREDRRLGDTLAAEQNGIVTWAVQGLRRLVENGWHLTPVPTEATTEWKESANHLAIFCRECITVPENAATTCGVLSRTLYRIYSEWCMQNGVTDKHPLITVCKQLPPSIRATKYHSRNGTVYGIILRDCMQRIIRPDEAAKDQTAEA